MKGADDQGQMANGKRRPLVVLIHGILARQTTPGWPNRLEQWLWKKPTTFECITRRYAAGPLPMWNVFFKNRYLALALANDLEPFLQDGAELNFVTHSNGADVAVKAMKILAKRGYKTNTAIFVGAAISCDIGRSGLYELHQTGFLKRAFAYCSQTDLALRFRVTWPYGHLGRVGFRFGGVDDGYWNLHTTRRDEEPGNGFFTRWFPGGHTGYWQPENELATFEQILRDLNPVPF